MATTTVAETIQETLEKADPNTIPDAFRKMKFARMATVIKVTVAALGATATPNITSAAVKAAATIAGVVLASGENLPPIGQVLSLRISASGTAGSLGTYAVSDAGGTAIVPPGGASAAVGVALLNDAGTVITFPNTVTGFVIQYVPRSNVDISTTKFAPST